MCGDKFSIVNWALVGIDYNNDKEGDEGFHIIKECHVGCPEQGKESALGQGDSYTRGMLVYTWNGSTYTDVSDEAKSISGPTFGAGTADGDAIYVSSDLQDNTDYLQFYGIKADVTTALVEGTGRIAVERWNGTIWEEFGHMSCQSAPPILPFADKIFERTGSEQVRFGLCMLEDWVKHDPISSGTPRWWVRFRNEGAITTAPVFEQYKVHSSRFEVNSDGWLEYFGKARPLGTLPWSIDDIKAWSSSPPNQDLYVLNSTNGADYDIGVGRSENSLQPNVRDRVSVGVPTPFDLDSSCNIVIEIYWMGTSATAGDIQWRLSSGISSLGDTVGIDQGSAPTTLKSEHTEDNIEAVGTGEDGIFKRTEFLVPVRSCIPRDIDGISDIISISIIRDGNDVADDYPGVVNIYNIRASYYKWSEGGHF